MRGACVVSGRARPGLPLAEGFGAVAGGVDRVGPRRSQPRMSRLTSVRAVGLGNGTVLGSKAPFAGPGLTARQAAFIARDTRAYVVPAAFSPYDVLCVDGWPDRRDSCLEVSTTGNFQPLGYVLPAVAIRVSSDATTGLWSRVSSSAMQSLAFLLLAIALLWSGTGWSVIGLLVAITPMVLYTASILNPSGIETASSLAFAASLLRISRAPERVPRWVWIRAR